jgi:hypothetical protein
MMPALSALTFPAVDSSPIFDHFRGAYATELLAAGAQHFRIFERLAERPLAADELGRTVGLASRPLVVLTTALRAMGLLVVDSAKRFELTPLAREYLLPGQPFYMGDYFSRASTTAGILEMVERLRTNRPADDIEVGGAQYLFREGLDSAMDDDAAARRLTLALAGRAKIVAPALAANVPLPDAKLLVDVGGGSAIYSIALVQKNPHLRAIVWDRPAVLKVAQEMIKAYGVADRMQCVPGDMFTDPAPAGADALLLSNILHDWDVPEARGLVNRLAGSLSKGGRFLIHDVFLDDDLSGPLPVALYSAALFVVTEGRAYSGAEYAGWLRDAGLTPQPIVPTAVRCGVLMGIK